ncbi:MAG: glycosylase, partial [Planctomycetes bacterium]|nr:glycosylase [Planctomycetota bacterium]
MLFYSTFVYGGELVSAEISFPTEVTGFEPISANPVFTAGGEGHWDVKIRERGWILRDNQTWKMWYTGYDGTRPGKKMLGYATSTDGRHWTPYPSNPIHQDHWVEDVCVIIHDGTYYMFAEGENDQAQLLTSQDGITWKREGSLDVRQQSGAPISTGPYGTPTVWYENGIWNLFYERSDRGIWLARSRDLKTFTNVQDEPVIRPGLMPDEPKDNTLNTRNQHDRDLIAMNQIIKIGNFYIAVLHGATKPTDPA